MILRHIRYLMSVAQHRNFTRAAEELHVSQPTLSQQIKQLEESLGAQLLDRSGRIVQLTDAGEVFLRHARRALDDLDAGKRAIHDVQDLSRGSLRLAMTPPFTCFLIGPLVEGFNARYPGITLNVREMTQDHMEAALANDEIDIGIAFADTPSATKVIPPDLKEQILFVETLDVIVSRHHALARNEAPLSAQELDQIEMVLLDKDFILRVYIDQYCREHNITPAIAIETNSISAIVEIVRHSRLATILPHTIACKQCDLYPITLVPALPNRLAVLLQRKDAYQTAACRAFVTLMLDLYTEPPAGSVAMTSGPGESVTNTAQP